jgi:uncharacterized protein (TIGR00730 family)
MSDQSNLYYPKVLNKTKHVVRLSSVLSGVLSDSDGIPQNAEEWRKERHELIELLRNAGFTIRNGSGDEVIGLQTIQDRSIKVSDAFVFMPSPTLAEVFKFVSLIVGYQTDDPELKGKPTIVVDLDDSWEPVFAVLSHLHQQGMMLDAYGLFTVVSALEEVVPALQEQIGVYTPDHLKTLHAEETEAPKIGKYSNGQGEILVLDDRQPPEFNVGVFCSASTTDRAYRKMAYSLGHLLATSGYGAVFGAGNTGMMGELMQGALDYGGYVRGANIWRIANIEGIPSGLGYYWGDEEGIDDIYKRVAVMVEHSDAFIILPGGAGTLQELLALFLLVREQGNPLMIYKSAPTQFKEIILVSSPLQGTKGRFYDSIIKLIEVFGYQEGREFHVVKDETEAMDKLHALQKGWEHEKLTGNWSTNGHHPMAGPLSADEGRKTKDESLS